MRPGEPSGAQGDFILSKTSVNLRSRSRSVFLECLRGEQCVPGKIIHHGDREPAEAAQRSSARHPFELGNFRPLRDHCLPVTTALHEYISPPVGL